MGKNRNHHNNIVTKKRTNQNKPKADCPTKLISQSKQEEDPFWAKLLKKVATAAAAAVITFLAESATSSVTSTINDTNISGFFTSNDTNEPNK